MQKTLFFFVAFILLFCPTLFAQKKGKVVDSSTGEPLLGVNIYMRVNQGITITDNRGEFSLSNSFERAGTIYFSHIGYRTYGIGWQELKKAAFFVRLTEETQTLGQVTVTVERHFLKPNLDYEVLAPIPTATGGFAGTIYNGKIYVTGGDISTADAGMSDSFKKFLGASSEDLVSEEDFPNIIHAQFDNRLYLYDIATDTWRQLKPRLSKRAYHAVHYYDGCLYILGGKRLGINRKREYLDEKIEIYDLKRDTLLTDSHTNPHEAVNFASCIFQNNLIVMGGSIAERRSGGKIYTDKSHVLDLKTGYWYELTNMPYKKETNGILAGHSVYLIGGFDARPRQEVEVYDIVTGLWAKGTQLEFAVGCPALASNDSVIYIFEKGILQTYDINTQQVKAYRVGLDIELSKMFYYNNKLYILGGRSSSEAYREVYSISIDKFEKCMTWEGE